MSKAMDDKNKIGEELFGIADDLMLAQRDLINNQNDLIRRLMDRVDYLERNNNLAGIRGAL